MINEFRGVQRGKSIVNENNDVGAVAEMAHNMIQTADEYRHQNDDNTNHPRQ